MKRKASEFSTFCSTVFNTVSNSFQTPEKKGMLISRISSEKLREAIARRREVYCSGLFLSARWFVLSGVASSGMQLVILPDQESAEYCSSDLYNLVEGDCVFFLPASGKNIERSNYKSASVILYNMAERIVDRLFY